MQITKKYLEQLKPLVENVRKHNPAQIKEIMRSLDQFGQTRPMVVDEDGNILVGNGLYMAMVERGDKQADCYVLSGLTEPQKKKLILTDNKVYSLGQDDYDVIDKFIQEITIDAGDFDIAGFDEDILRSMSRDMQEAAANDFDYDSMPAELKAVSLGTASAQPEAQAMQPPTEGSAPQAQAAQPPAPQVPAAQPAQAAASMSRSVTCPHCGQVIYID